MSAFLVPDENGLIPGKQLCDVPFAGLADALELLKDIADKYEGVSYADLFQLASVTGIEVRTVACMLFWF